MYPNSVVVNSDQIRISRFTRNECVYFKKYKIRKIHPAISTIFTCEKILIIKENLSLILFDDFNFLKKRFMIDSSYSSRLVSINLSDYDKAMPYDTFQ
jgi:hypothetical protein